jgi:hypothetical protein
MKIQRCCTIHMIFCPNMHVHKLVANILLLANAALVVIATSAESPTIYITRHGEKIWALGCLNATGNKPQ